MRRRILILLFNLFLTITILSKQYPSHISVNLIKPLKIITNDIDFGTYVIGAPRPKEKRAKIILKDAELNKSIDISVNPLLSMSANGGSDIFF